MSKELQHLKYEDGAFENLEEEVRTMKHDYNATKTQVQNQGARFSWLDFEYQKPEPNFNDSLVYGVAAKLFSIKNNKFTIALETAAGGKVSSNYSKNPHLLRLRTPLYVNVKKTWNWFIAQPRKTAWVCRQLC